MKTFYKAFYFSKLLYYIIAAEVLLLVIAFFYPYLDLFANYGLIAIIALVVADTIVLYANRSGVIGGREAMDKLSNGDDNPIRISIKNRYSFPVRLTVIDELPFQFQVRNMEFKIAMEGGSSKMLEYDVHPVKRGEYSFGALNVFARSPIGLIERRYCFSQDMLIPVYPSFLQMRKYELLAISNFLSDSGIKKIRKIGNNSEFERIKEYVAGDEFRTINWKATARRGKLMTNQYQDERSQQVYSLIDMGRAMKMPFEGLSLLDYSINTSLVISNIAMMKEDKAGIITFSDKVQTILPADRRGSQLQKIMELLYNQKTGYQETDFQRLYATIKRKINQRSLLLIYSNFESLSGLQRQIRYLRMMADSHLVVLIFFKNTELEQFILKPAITTEDVYNKAIAEKFIYEKKLVVKELERYGIHSIYTEPSMLSVSAINKYLDLKSRGMI